MNQPAHSPTPEQSPALAVELDTIWKRFPGVIANAGASLQVRTGSVHAVLGENGAGKTTLMNVLAGVYRPDQGRVMLGGVEQQFTSPADAIAGGIGMVHQEFRLVPTFTVTENVVLGAAPRLLSQSSLNAEVGALAERFGLRIKPDRQVWQLSMGERQRVEILKALWRDAQVLILDEPTAVLTPVEVEDLGEITSAMASDGRSIIFISHKLDEVTTFCDQATVLRGGKTVAANLAVPDLTAAMLGELMVGEATQVSQRRVRTTAPGDPVLQVRDLVVVDLHGRSVVDGVSFTVHAGEIVGIAGIAGNGQRPLADAIAGLRPSTGQVMMGSRDMSKASPNQRHRQGLSYVPEDRIGVGLAPRLSVTDNAIMRTYRGTDRSLLIDREQSVAHAEELVADYNVKVADLHAPIAGLSGGNLQRLLVGREVDGEPTVLIAAQPTRGLDVQGVAAIQQVLVDQLDSGVGVVLISEDLNELLALSDRLLVMHKGMVVADFDPETTTRAQVGVAMTGQGD